jgi:formate dehydrogenase assembly factor FdhD
MLREGKPDYVFVLPGGRGTMNMVMQAKEAGVPVTFAKGL